MGIGRKWLEYMFSVGNSIHLIKGRKKRVGEIKTEENDRIIQKNIF